ncbi:hypothetical protein SLA2020_350560 [Shorea laevis]
MAKVEVGKVKVEMDKTLAKVKTEMEKESGKVKTEVDNEIVRYRKEIEIEEIKLQPMKKNYETMLVCLWILCAFCMFLLVYTYKGSHDGIVDRMMLP